MSIEALWDIARNLGPGGAVLLLLLWLDERRERREVQKTVERLHHENMERSERLHQENKERFDELFERLTTSHAQDARGPSTARSEPPRRGGGNSGRD